MAVDERVSVTINDGVTTRPVFVSYATADRKQALAVCQALEARGTRCWISCRDVPPGENYQEAIVRDDPRCARHGPGLLRRGEQQ